MKKLFILTTVVSSLLINGDAQAYTGRLQCSNLTDTLAKFSALHVKSYCKEAIQACRIREMLDRTDPNHPLYKVLDGRIHEKITLALEICELAFLDHDPQHYEENLKRPPIKKSAAKAKKTNKDEAAKKPEESEKPKKTETTY